MTHPKTTRGRVALALCGVSPWRLHVGTSCKLRFVVASRKLRALFATGHRTHVHCCCRDTDLSRWGADEPDSSHRLLRRGIGIERMA